MSRDPVVRRVYIFHVWILSLRIVLPHGSDAAAVSLKKRREFHVVHFRESVFFFYASRGGGGSHPLSFLKEVDACRAQIKTRHGKFRNLCNQRTRDVDVFVKSTNDASFFKRRATKSLLSLFFESALLTNDNCVRRELLRSFTLQKSLLERASARI
jgi:hypothetical protein